MNKFLEWCSEYWPSLVFACTCLVVVGMFACGVRQTDLKRKEQDRKNQVLAVRHNQGALQLEIFYQCLDRAKQTQESTVYNDADEIVKACKSTARLLSWDIVKSKEGADQ